MKLSQEQLKAVASHKYIGGEYSWLDNKMNPFWEFVATLFPDVKLNLINLVCFAKFNLDFKLSIHLLSKLTNSLLRYNFAEGYSKLGLFIYCIFNVYVADFRRS